MADRDPDRWDSRERDLLRAVLDSAEDAIFVKDPQHRFVLNNLAHQRLLGAQGQEELLGKTNADYWGEERASPHHADDRLVLDRGESILGREEPIRLPSGGEMWISTNKVPLKGPDGSIEGLVAISRDITGRKLAEDRLQTVVENAPLVLFALDTAGIFTLSKGRGLQGLGQKPEEAVGESIFELYRNEPRVLDPVGRALAGEEFADTVEARGRVFDVRYTPLRDEEGSFTGTIGVAVDVTERAALETEISRRNFYDPLTGLPNRALLLKSLESVLSKPVRPARGARRRRTVAVLCVDLDDFGVVSGSLGDPAGEPGGAAGVLLREVSGRLSGCTRPEDLVARTGDAEFAVLFGTKGGKEWESTSPRSLRGEGVGSAGGSRGSRAALKAAEGVAQRTLEALSEPFELADGEGEAREAYLRASLGIALGKVGEKEPAVLLAEAEAAVSRAKHEGRGRLALYEQGTTELIRKRVELEGELARAARHPEEEFRLLYQPYVELQSRRIVGAEALLRWEHPRRGLLMPEEFVGLAEEMGAIQEIGAWTLGEAARQAARWRDARETPEAMGAGGRGFVVGVNASARQLSEPGFPDTVRRILSEAGLQAEVLTLEITESALAGGEEESRVILTLREIRAAGVTLAIDDFGTGHSSLARLGRLPVDYLKLDRSFIAELGEELGEEPPDPSARAIVRAAVELGRSLGVGVVAEGVETGEQLEALREAGCELGQGYLLHQPMSAGELSALLAADGG